MLGAWSVDPTTVAVLGLVLWLDGWRRTSSTDGLLVRFGIGDWIEREPWARLGPFALVGWWPPIVIPIVVSMKDSAGRGAVAPPWSADFFTAAARGRRRLRRVRLVVALLRMLGVLLLGWIALAIPLATGRFGVHGLVRGILLAFAMSFGMALLAMLGLRCVGVARAASIRATVPLLSPFTAPRACELVVAASVRDLSPLAQIAALFGAARFLRWIRPAAYDALHGRTDELGREPNPAVALVATLPRAVLEHALNDPPSDEVGVRHCPRCARAYRQDIATCHDCDALALVSRPDIQSARKATIAST